MITTKKFEGMDDIIEYAYIMFHEKDNISILCDVDSMEELRKMLDYDDYTEIGIDINSDNEVYYISKFIHDDECALYIEPATYKGKLITNRANIMLVLDYVEEDYDLGNIEECNNFELLHYEEDFEDDEKELDGCDYCVREEFEILNSKLDRLIELLDKPTVFNISELKLPTEIDAQDIINSLKNLPDIFKKGIYTR